MFRLKKYQFEIFLFIILLFHISGLLGILFSNHKDFFISNTPLTIILSTLLLILSQEKLSKNFILFFIVVSIFGIVVEIIGVNTGFLFGNYTYGKPLGIKIAGVPILMGLLWFTTIFTSGVVMNNLKLYLQNNSSFKQNNTYLIIAHIVDASLLAVMLDWVMEPVAVKLGFWTWVGIDGEIPFFNYACWFFCSFVLQILFVYLKFDKENKLAPHLFFIQFLFFLFLRLFL